MAEREKKADRTPREMIESVISLLQESLGELPEPYIDGDLQGLQHAGIFLLEARHELDMAIVSVTYECGRQEGVMDGAFMMVPGKAAPRG